jgi:hypothetical protein
VRNVRSVAVDGGISGHDRPWFSSGLPGRYGHWLLPVCCPGVVADPTFGTTIRIARVLHPQLRELEGRRAAGSAGPLATTGDRRCLDWTVVVRTQRGPTDFKVSAVNIVPLLGIISHEPTLRHVADALWPSYSLPCSTIL